VSKKKKGRQRAKVKAARARAKAKTRAAKAARACHFCGETERHMRRFKASFDGKPEADWKLCRSCAAVTMVLLRDQRRR
jgi:hypothetical protein